ncbi:MAG: mannan-binding lectin [Pseudomonadota bacterium]
MKLVRLAAAAAMLTLGTFAVAMPAQAQSDNGREGATGRTVNWVAFADGQYRRQPDGTWAELNTQGRITFRFRETGRDDWSVYLTEIGSDKQLQLDLHRMMVTISQGGAPRSDLYPILSARYPGSTAPPAAIPIRPAPTPAPPPRYGDYRDTVTSGLTLRRVSHADGYFEQSGGDSAWTEYGANGRATYHFREQSRDQNAVRLLDSSRNTRVEFDLGRRIIRISWGGAPFEDLYPIVATQHTGGTAGGRPVNLPPPAQLPPVSLPPAPRPEYGAQDAFNVEAGPITSQRDAEAKCPALGYRIDGDWTGGWQRRDGRLSVCEFRFGGGDRRDDRAPRGGRRGGTEQVEVGPIWSQSDAEGKCRNKAAETGGEWTGQWSTTIQGRMSVCEIRYR